MEQELRTYGLIDLFCGCGGMSLGFHRHGLFRDNENNPACFPPDDMTNSTFESRWVNDFNEHALKTYVKNFDCTNASVIPGPIEDALSGNVKIPRADVVIGGPPCQGFSLLNKNREGDDRRGLWSYYMDVVERSNAKVIVMENVPQLLGSPEFDQILESLSDLGFGYLMAHKLCSANFGVPQVRHRTILMASRKGPIALPRPTHLHPDIFQRLDQTNPLYKKDIALWKTTRDAIEDLEDPHGTEIRNDAGPTLRLHFGRNPTQKSLERYKAVPKGGNRFDLQKNRPDITPNCWLRKKSGGTDLFGRLWWEKPSVTIRTEFFKPEKGRYLHPEKHRPITHREAARLQSFPDRFEFVGSKAEIARQIGNAVPPLMAFAIAGQVCECLENKTSIDQMKCTEDFYRSVLKESIRETWYGAGCRGE